MTKRFHKPPAARRYGKNYRTEEFVMFIMNAEVAIQEAVAIIPSITDGDVVRALNRLIEWLETHSVLPHIDIGKVSADGVLTIDADKVHPIDLIATRIVNNWHIAMEEYGERSTADLAGCLRVVMDSVETWTRGPQSRGYLAYAADFLKKAGVKIELRPSDEKGKPLPEAEAGSLPEVPEDLDHMSLEELGTHLLEEPTDDEAFEVFLNRAILYLVSGRGEELVNYLTPLVEQVKDETLRGNLLWILGRAHLRLGRAHQAVNVLRRVVNAEPKFLEAWIALAEAQHASGSRTAAAHAWEQARVLDRKRVEVYPRLAAVYRELGDPQSEIATWERFVAASSRSLLAHYGLANAYRRVKRDADADRELARVRKMEPASRAQPADWAVWLRMQIETNRIAQTAPVLERALRRDERTNWFIPLFLLAAAEVRGDADAGQSAWEMIQSQNQPWDPLRQEIEPILRDKLPPTSRVLQPMRTAAESPTEMSLALPLASVRRRDQISPGKLAEGERLRQRARQPKALDRRDVDRMEQLSQEGFRLVQRGDYAAAERAFRRALEIAEGDATLYGLGVVCAMTNRTEEAFELFSRAVEANDQDADYWYNLGTAAARTIRPGRALQAFERCVELGMKDRDLDREVKEHIRLLREAIDGMYEDWGKELTLEQLIRHEEIFGRGVQAMERGEYVRAVELFRESLTVNERHYQSWGNLGVCLLQLDELDEGERALRRALEIKPTYEFARFNLEALAQVRAGAPKPPMVVTDKLDFKPAGLRFRE